jgi:DNA topoisomerase IB
VARLRRVDCSGAGITRIRRGRGFEYRDEAGRPLRDPEVLARIRALAIPPAWRDVWICTHPMGHIQATGVDDAGRKQYRYHDRWRERRDREKFESMLVFAERLPRLRRHAGRDLGAAGMPRERVLACAVRLLDHGSFRIGGEAYAAENETYGIATMRRRDVSVGRDGTIRFDYAAKGGQQLRQTLRDKRAAAVVRELAGRRGGGPELLAYRDGRRWLDVRSDDVNEYLKDATGADVSAKDFRTWNATVLAAASLAAAERGQPRSKAARGRAIRSAIEDVARHLGNTPAVCRASYIDPRVIDRFEGGQTIAGPLPRIAPDGSWPRIRRGVEQAVVDLIRDA